MAGLARSELTINFSLANGGPHEQYKIRVHEASLVGCICLTDDGDRSRHFFAPNEYQFFPSVEALPDLIAARLADRECAGARPGGRLGPRARAVAHGLTGGASTSASSVGACRG